MELDQPFAQVLTAPPQWRKEDGVSSEHSERMTIIWPAAGWRSAAGIILLAALVFAGYLIFEKYLRVAATIVLLALMFTYLLEPMVDWLARLQRTANLHTARAVAVLVIYFLLLAALYGFGAVTVQTLTRDFTALQSTWVNAEYHIPAQLANLQRWYENTIPPDIRAQLDQSIQNEVKEFPGKVMPTAKSWIFGIAKTSGKWLGFLIELIFVPLVAFYLLTDARKLREQAMSFVPARFHEKVVLYGGATDRILRVYVRSQVILCGIAWIVVTVALLLMGIPGALLLGVVAGVSRAIPVLGPLVGGVPVLSAVVLNSQWVGAFWWVLIGFTLLHLFESKILMPRILGDSLGIHPVLIIVSLLIGYEILGLLGMFLAPPAVAMIRFTLTQYRAAAATSTPADADTVSVTTGIDGLPDGVVAP